MKKKDAMIACPNCEGNGHEQVYWEAEEVLLECKACSSSGKIDKDKWYSQTWEEGIPSYPTYYYGPLLDDPTLFKKYRIQTE
jgi:DnaJ-class molecular chaperone